MLGSKFCVFTTDRIFHNVSKFPFSVHHLKLLDKILSCNVSNKSNSDIQKYQLNLYNKSERSIKDLVRYSKRTRVEQYHGNQNPLHKHETISIVSEYEEIRKRVSDLIREKTKFINEEKQTIVESLKKEARVDKENTSLWLKSISNSIDQKLQQLIQLDPCFGSEIRITVLRFKDHARNTFIALHYELAPSVKQIESTLEKMQTEVAQSLQKAAVQTLLCRCEGSPSSFKKCLVDNEIEAGKIVERTMEETKKKLEKVKKLRDYILKCHRDALSEETNNHLFEMQALSRYLDDCIVTIKKQKK